MSLIHAFPYFEVQFTKDGEVHDQQEVTNLMDFLGQGEVTDLFVISHGWNNDMTEARNLYGDFLARLREVLDSGDAAVRARTYAVATVLWPSKKFADKKLIASGAAGAVSPVSDDMLLQALDQLKAVFDQPEAQASIETAGAMVPDLEDSPQARGVFVDKLRSLLTQKSINHEDASKEFFKLSGEEIITRLSKPTPIEPPKMGAGTGAASRIGSFSQLPVGEAAGITQGFGIKSGVLNFLNYLTYYEMKERAGTVGRDGLNPLLQNIRQQKASLKLHLIGHSFGGRLVTAAVDGVAGRPALQPASLTLLQAAFSHYGFAAAYDGVNNGFFRRVIAEKMVSGPVLITCSKNDVAVGKLYPIASLIAGQVAAELGDKNDKFGGIGRNGAQKTPEAHDELLLEVGGPYVFQPGGLYNLNADASIMNHSDICKPEIAYAVLRAVAVT